MRGPSLIFCGAFAAMLYLTSSLTANLLSFCVALGASIGWRFFVRPKLLLEKPNNCAVIVTGCSSGIGRASALKFHREGFTVFACVRKAADAPKGKHIVPVILDVTKKDQIADAARAVAQHLVSKRLTLFCVFNCAGVMPQLPLEEVSMEKADFTLRVNCTGMLEVARVFMPLLREHAERKGRSHLMFVSSTAGLLSSPTYGLYAASKFAIEGAMDALRYEAGHFGVRVSVFEFGTIESNLGDMLAKEANNIPSDSLYSNFWANAAKWTNEELRKDAPKADAAAEQVYAATQARWTPSRVAFMRPSEYPLLALQYFPDEIKDLVAHAIFGKMW